MQRTTEGEAFVDGQRVGHFLLTRTYEPRLVRVPMGPRDELIDRGVETQPYVRFPDVEDEKFRGRLQAMIDAQSSLEERRRLRDSGGLGVRVTLVEEAGETVEGSVMPPNFAHQRAAEATFPISLAR